ARSISAYAYSVDPLFRLAFHEPWLPGRSAGRTAHQGAGMRCAGPTPGWGISFSGTIRFGPGTHRRCQRHRLAHGCRLRTGRSGLRPERLLCPHWGGWPNLGGSDAALHRGPAQCSDRSRHARRFRSNQGWGGRRWSWSWSWSWSRGWSILTLHAAGTLLGAAEIAAGQPPGRHELLSCLPVTLIKQQGKHVLSSALASLLKLHGRQQFESRFGQPPLVHVNHAQIIADGTVSRRQSRCRAQV